MKIKLRNHEGEVFYTKTGLPFTYKLLSDNEFTIIRNGKTINRIIRVNELNKAVQMSPIKPSDLTNEIQGSAYVFALINDNRLK